MKDYLNAPVTVEAFLDFSSVASRALLLGPHGLRGTFVDSKKLTRKVNFHLVPISSGRDAEGQQMNEAVACLLNHAGSSKTVLPVIACLVSTFNDDELNLLRLPVCVHPVLGAAQARRVQYCIDSGEGTQLLAAARWELDHFEPSALDADGDGAAASLPRVVLNHELIGCADGRCDLLSRVCKYLPDDDDCWLRSGSSDFAYEYRF